MDTLFKSTGILRYSIVDPQTYYKLIVEIDPDLSRYYRSLIPKYIKTNPQAYAPHITVVRKEVPPNLDKWGIYEGKEVEFYYSNIVYNGEVYYWLNTFSVELERIRLELGLPVSTEYTRPPSDEWVKCFHCTIANIKVLK